LEKDSNIYYYSLFYRYFSSPLYDITLWIATGVVSFYMISLLCTMLGIVSWESYEFDNDKFHQDLDDVANAADRRCVVVAVAILNYCYIIRYLIQ
jgi:hypothetical protein